MIGLLIKNCLFFVLFEVIVKCIWFWSYIFFVGCWWGICFWYYNVFGYKNIVDDFNIEVSDYSIGDD